MIEKLLGALALGIAAAKLTEKQQQTIVNTVSSQGFNLVGIGAEAPTDIEVETDVIDQNLPRGIRNNNPGNIRYDGTRWQGLDEPPSDGAFCRFVDVRYGIRAMVKILNSYYARNIDSVEAIISTWSPASENDTQAYISHVAFTLDVLRDSYLPKEKWPELIAAIIKHENGQQPYTLAAINEGVALA
jgi:hypothetical protein